ncbi:MAG: proC [Firmicutes bacterium]|nr:proC [Bacillota bacterium]
MLSNKTIGFIGGGAMAEALVRGILAAKLVTADKITVCDVAEERLKFLSSAFGVATSLDSKAVAGKVDVLFLAVKPQVIHGILSLIAPAVKKETLVITIAAGITIAAVEDKLPGVPIIRVMPNTPVAVSAGMAAVALGSHATTAMGDLTSLVFSAVGRAVVVAESAMDAVTGLSGSGPSFAYVLIDALSDAGVRVGLPRQMSLTLAAQTLLGAAKMVLDTGEHPAKLRDMVTSPGGTSIAGVHVLEQRGVRAALIDAVVAAAERSREMGKK